MIESISKFILTMMLAAPNNPVVKNEEFRKEISSQIVFSANKHGIDPYIVALWIKRESSFKVSVVSKSNLKEFGLGQFHGVSYRICRSAGLKLRSRNKRHAAAAQIECTALLMAVSKNKCGGDMRRGLYNYMAGTCKGTPAAIRQYRWRMRELQKTKEAMQ